VTLPRLTKDALVLLRVVASDDVGLRVSRGCSRRHLDARMTLSRLGYTECVRRGSHCFIVVTPAGVERLKREAP